MQGFRELLIVSIVLIGGCSIEEGKINTTLKKDGPIPTGIRPGEVQTVVETVHDRVFFEFDRYDLSDEARQILQRHARWMKEYPKVYSSVEGHADERGTREYNLALSERRANAARDYLIALGISPARLTAVGYGKERPAILGTGELVWSQNRRTVSVPQLP